MSARRATSRAHHAALSTYRSMRTQWNALVAANETNTIFQTYEWFDAWWQAFGAARELFLLVVREGDAHLRFRRAHAPPQRLRLAPARIRRHAATPTTRISSCRTTSRARWPPSAASCAANRLALGPPGAGKRARRIPRRCHCCSRRPRHGGMHVVDEIHVPCPTLLLRAESAHAQHMIDKYSLRRPLNWFRKHGKVTFRHVELGRGSRAPAADVFRPAPPPLGARSASAVCSAKARQTEFLRGARAQPAAARLAAVLGGRVQRRAHRVPFRLRLQRLRHLVQAVVRGALRGAFARPAADAPAHRGRAATLAPRARLHDRRRVVQGALLEPSALQRECRRLSRAALAPGRDARIPSAAHRVGACCASCA